MTGAEFDGVDIDLLADYIGGALAGTPDEPVVAALVADDPAWRQAYESLGDAMALVGAELGRFQAEPMPAELAAELDTMLRTAPPLDEPAPAPRLTVVRGDDDVPLVSERPKRPGRRVKWAAPIGIAAGVAAFAGFGAPYLLGGSDNSQSDAAGSSAADMPAQAEAAPDGQILASGTDYTEATLGQLPAQPMAAAETSASKEAPQRSAAREPSLGRLAVRAALDACFAEIERENAAGTISVQSADYARFEGSPALVVRFSAENGQWAWASGPGCGTPGSGADTLGKVPVR